MKNVSFRLLFLSVLVLLICVYDPLHYPGSHRITCGEINEGDAFNVPENLPGLDKPAGRCLGKVNLGDISGYYSSGIFTNPSKKHLHLGLSGVLSLIKDDACIVDASSPHVS